jgi:hypothetical protein
MEGQRHYGRGSGGSVAQDTEPVLGAMVARRTGGGGGASDRWTETKEERADWAAKAGWAGFRNGK